MWINTRHTEKVRQHLEADFCVNLAVEQQFPSHPNGGTRYRLYRTDIDGPEAYTSDVNGLREILISRGV